MNAESRWVVADLFPPYPPSTFGHTSTPPPGHPHFIRRDSLYWYVLQMGAGNPGGIHFQIPVPLVFVMPHRWHTLMVKLLTVAE